MIKDTLLAIKDVEIFPVVTLILFVVVFILVTFYIFKLDKKQLNRWSRLPLDDNEIIKSIGIQDRLKADGE